MHTVCGGTFMSDPNKSPQPLLLNRKRIERETTISTQFNTTETHWLDFFFPINHVPQIWPDKYFAFAWNEMFSLQCTHPSIGRMAQHKSAVGYLIADILFTRDGMMICKKLDTSWQLLNAKIENARIMDTKITHSNTFTKSLQLNGHTSSNQKKIYKWMHFTLWEWWMFLRVEIASTNFFTWNST